MKKLLLIGVLVLLFGCKKPDAVKPRQYASIDAMSNPLNFTKCLTITYTDSNLILHTVIDTGFFGYDGLFKSGRVIITAYASDSSKIELSINLKNDGHTPPVADISGTGKQTLSYTVP